MDNVLIVLYYPADGFERLCRRRPYRQACVLYVLVAVVSVLSVLFTHYPLASVRPEETELFFEVCKILIPLMTFVVVNYGLSTLNDGEARFGEIFIGTAFSMLPYILLMPVATLLSRILSGNDSGLYQAVIAFIWIWVFYLFYRQVNVLNNYTFPQTVGSIVLTVFSMLIVWALLVLLYLLSRNLWYFFQNVWMEMNMLISSKGG